MISMKTTSLAMPVGKLLSSASSSLAGSVSWRALMSKRDFLLIYLGSGGMDVMLIMSELPDEMNTKSLPSSKSVIADLKGEIKG